MIEVGHSEPLGQLRTVAEWWLVNTGGLTRMVIILVPNYPLAMDIEVWELGSNPRRKTQSTPATISLASNTIQIDVAANVNPTNACLTIHPSATKIIFSHILLSEMVHHIFHQT